MRLSHTPPTSQAVYSHGIAIEQLLFLVLRHASQRAVDELPGFRVGRRRVRIVRLPHDILDANVMALLNASRLIPEVDVDLPPEEFAGTRHNTLRPQVPPLPLVVTAFQNVIHPSQAGLRTDPLQTWVTIQHAREDEIRDELRLHREAPRWPHGLFMVAGVAIPAWHS